MTTKTFDYRKLANPAVQNLTPYQPGKPLAELEREYGIHNAIKLASNENPLGPSPKALMAAQQALLQLTRYPEGNPYALKQAIAKRHQVTDAHVVLGNGSNDVLELVARAYLASSQNAVFSEHAFAVYPIVTQAVGATAHVAKALSAHSAQPYGHDLDAMVQAVDSQTRVVFIANPNNPTGTWLDAQALTKFLQAVPADVLVVIDEAYFEYVQVENFPDTSLWLGEYPNLIVTRTFSKVYGLAALRVGYALANPQIIDMLNRVRQPFNVNSIAQAAALAAFDDSDYVQQTVRLNRQGMQQMVAGLQALHLLPIPSAGNFICVKVGESGMELFQRLLPFGVIIRPVDNYGLPGFVRITIGTESENRRCLEALAKCI